MDNTLLFLRRSGFCRYHSKDYKFGAVGLKISYLIACLGVCLSLAGPVWSANQPVLILNDPNEPPYTTPEGTGFLDVIAGEAFRRAGVKLLLVKLPAERALINANKGVEDGDLTRIAGLEEKYPNLIRVPEKLVDWEFSAFSHNPKIKGDLEEIRKYSVGHIKGWKIYEGMMAGAPNIVMAEDSAQLFRQLELSRIEVALYMRWMGLALIQNQGLKDIVMLEPTLAKREMFIYLHKKHADLVPKIASALRAMKKEGFYDRQFRETVMVITEPSRK